MYAEKVSISLPPTLMQFVEEYKVSHERRSRSQVIEEALTLLRERELEAAYRDAADGTLARDFAPTISDGLANESW
ncbi:MAG: CopG family transcriptional regulator [Betaproteobacteria bacterium]